MFDDEFAELKRIEEKVDQILATMQATEAKVQAIVDQVAPALETLAKSPIMKMLGGK